MTEIIIHRPRNRARVVFLSVWAAIADLTRILMRLRSPLLIPP